VKKIKVMQIILDLGTGGVEKFLLDLILNYDREKFHMSVVSLNRRMDTMFENILENNRVKVTYLDMKPAIYNFKIYSLLYKLIKAEKPDVVNVHIYMTRFAFLPVMFNHVPVRIHTVHVPFKAEASGLYRMLLKFAYKKGKFVPVAVSKDVQRTIEEGSKVEAKCIYNGIDLNKFKTDVKRSFKEDGTIRIICIARFMPEKNHKMLVSAFNKVCQVYSNCKLYLVGEGTLKKQIQEMVSNFGIEDKVEFLGTRKDVPKLLNQSDIFLLSSNYEGFGLVIAEAMACGLPIVSTNVGAIHELIEHRHSGLLVEKGCIDEFASAIIELIENESLREKISHNAKDEVQKFSLTNMVREYEKLYMSLLDRGAVNEQ